RRARRLRARRQPTGHRRSHRATSCSFLRHRRVRWIDHPRARAAPKWSRQTPRPEGLSMKHRTVRALLALLAITTLAAACGGDDDDAASTAAGYETTTPASVAMAAAPEGPACSSLPANGEGS